MIFILFCCRSVYKDKMSSDLKKRLTKTVSSNPPRTSVADVVNKLERSYTTLGTSSDQTSLDKTSFPSLGSSACYQREGSSLSTASLPAVSPLKKTSLSASKSKIPVATFSRENLSSGRSTPISKRVGSSTFGSNNNLGLSNSSLADSVSGIPQPKTKFLKNGLTGQQQVKITLSEPNL